MIKKLCSIPYSWKFSRDLYFKNFMVLTKFVKFKTLKYFKSITLILSIAKIRENCILELANQSKFVKYRALENNQLYGTLEGVERLGASVYCLLQLSCYSCFVDGFQQFIQAIPGWQVYPAAPVQPALHDVLPTFICVSPITLYGF